MSNTRKNLSHKVKETAISSSGAIDKDKCTKYYRRCPDIYFETLGLYLCRECRRVWPVPQERGKTSLMP